MNKLKRLFRLSMYLLRKGTKSAWALPILAIVSFTESCCFVLPPEVPLIPMVILKPKRSVAFAVTTIVASILGAVCGYFLGKFLWDIVESYFFNYIPNFASYYDRVGELYEDNAFFALMIAGFTPIPYKVFTVVAGIYSDMISLSLVFWTAVLARGIRYSLFVFLLSYFARKKYIKFVKKYFGWITIAITLIIVAIVVIFKYL